MPERKNVAKLKHDINTPHEIYGGISLRLPHPLSEILKEIAFGATVVLMEVSPLTIRIPKQLKDIASNVPHLSSLD